MKMEEAAALGDLFITVTGNLNVIRYEHIEKMKDGSVLATPVTSTTKSILRHWKQSQEAPRPSLF